MARDEIVKPLSQDSVASRIEDGYFVFTLMPSLYCHLDCPHCYLSRAQRRDRQMLSPEAIELAARKLDAYWDRRGLSRREVVCYWYGGEPTSMPVDLFRDLVGRLGAVFDPGRGYKVSHVVLTSLVSVRDDWFNLFDELCGGRFQTSFDGLMRGERYVGKWHRKMEDARRRGLSVSTISVVNRGLLDDGPEQVLDYLGSLGVAEASFLPFMANEQNLATGKYAELAPDMNAWSDFMIALTRHWLARRQSGIHVPVIGQMAFILKQARMPEFANIAAQTLFLMPNGDLVLPDYRDGWHEFMRPFGNIIEQDFEAVLRSSARSAYLRRQVTRNGNADCLACPHADKCVMEFWKDNRPGDECFGGRRYVDFVLDHEKDIAAHLDLGSVRLF